MPTSANDTLAHRLVEILRKLNQGQKLNPKALAEEFGVHIRAIQRDLNERFSFLKLEKKEGFYSLPPALLGKLTIRDVERFASMAGVRGLFPSLTDDFLREVLNNRVRTALLVRGHYYEDLGNKEVYFHQLEEAILTNRLIAYTYDKPDGIKSYAQVEPYKLLNQNGIWYLAAKDGGRLKAFTLVKLDRLIVSDSTFTPDLSVDTVLATEDDIWLNEKKIEVILKITGEAAGFFRRRKLVPQQEIVKELKEDGGMLVSARVAHMNQILPIVREWIPHIRIISPEGLQAEMETTIRAYLQGI